MAGTHLAGQVGGTQRERRTPGRSLRVERLEDRRMLAGRAADAVNSFAFDVYDQMQREAGNLFFSPLSVATALAMAYAGAAGQTAAEMEQVLHLGTALGIHDAFAALLTSLKAHASPGGPDLAIANAIWPQLGLPIRPAFLATMDQKYDGHVQSLDYSNPSAAEDVINGWVEDQTHNKIHDLVSNLDSNTAMVLTNALYFKAFWQFPFDHRYTSNSAFTLANGSTIYTPTMVTQVWSTAITTINGFQVLDMPFKAGAAGADLSMILVLPPAPSNGRLSSQVYSQIDAWLAGAQPTNYAELMLPKFKTEVSTDFGTLLAGLGMPTAFGPDADFSSMTPAPVFIDKVFHKTFLEVNEEGTEAAAATEVQFAICFAKGTPILTPDGDRLIDELKSGDLVLARDEGNLEGELRPKRVEAVHRNEAAVLEVHVSGNVIRATAQHPFFVRKKGWTAASELRSGDSLSTNAGAWIAIDDVRPTDEVVTVYNLRVADYRTYFVGSAKWKFAVWVHNACIPEFYVDRPFHMFIRDNTTSTILFMGRISNPAQLQNTVTPTVLQPNADFDGSLVVDGADVLAWQRGLGRTTGAAHHDGDSDQDGDVDKADLGHWAGAFGQTLPPGSSEFFAAASSPLVSQATPALSPSAALMDAALAQHGSTNDSRSLDGSARPDLDFASAFGDATFSPAPSRSISSKSLGRSTANPPSSLDAEGLATQLTAALAAGDDAGIGEAF